MLSAAEKKRNNKCAHRLCLYALWISHIVCSSHLNELVNLFLISHLKSNMIVHFCFDSCRMYWCSFVFCCIAICLCHENRQKWFRVYSFSHIIYSMMLRQKPHESASNKIHFDVMRWYLSHYNTLFSNRFHSGCSIAHLVAIQQAFIFFFHGSSFDLVFCCFCC